MSTGVEQLATSVKGRVPKKDMVFFPDTCQTFLGDCIVNRAPINNLTINKSMYV